MRSRKLHFGSAVAIKVEKLFLKQCLMVCLFLCCASCTEPKPLPLPFQADEVVRIELYQIEDLEQSDSRFLVNKEEIKDIVDRFSKFLVSPLEAVDSAESAIYFCFYQTNGEVFTISYEGKGVKNGVVQTSDGNAFHSTADINGVWRDQYSKGAELQ